MDNEKPENEVPATAARPAFKYRNKGGRPRKELDVVAVLSSPEGQAAVAAAAEKAAEKAMASFADQIKALGSPVQGAPSGDMNMFAEILNKLSLNMADLGDQGTGRIRVAPEVQAKRTAARDKMGELIVAAYESGEVPIYSLLTLAHIDDRLVQPLEDVGGIATPVEFGSYRAPGPSWRPVNDTAKAIFTQYDIWIGGIPDAESGAEKQPIWVTIGKEHGSMRAVQTMAGASVKGLDPRRNLGGVPDSGSPKPPTSQGMPGYIPRPGQNRPAGEGRNVLGTVMPKAHNIVPGEARGH